MAGTCAGIVVGRPTVLAAGGRARVAAAGPASLDLAALLGVQLLGARMEPVFGLADPRHAASAFAQGAVDAVLLRGHRVPDQFAALAAAGAQPLFTLGVLGRHRPGSCAIRPSPTCRISPNCSRHATGTRPNGPLYDAWSAAAAAAQLEFGLVLPQLTPAAMVALWRRAGTDAVASLGVQATAATVDVRPLGGPAATANTAASPPPHRPCERTAGLARRPVQLAPGLSSGGRMKLWYQSMSRQTEWGGYPRVLRGILDKVRDPDTEIHVAGITEIGGIGDQFRYLEYLETGEVLKNVHRAVREGFDAFLIGNIADPGLQEAREIADIPVLGLCESALHVACMMGASFSLGDHQREVHPAHRGERAALRAARSAGGGEPHAGGAADRSRRGFEMRTARERIVAQFNRAAQRERRGGRRGGDRRRRRGDGAAGACRHPRRRRHADPERHHQPGEAGRDGGEDEPPDGRAVHVEALHRMRRRRPDQIAEFRKHYGADIYPTVKARMTREPLSFGVDLRCHATCSSAPRSANRRWCAR